MKSQGATFYSADPAEEGGEDWHYEPGNVLYAPDGTVVWAAPSAAKNRDSGNPGHELQTHGHGGVASYGGRSAHEIAVRDHGLQVQL